MTASCVRRAVKQHAACGPRMGQQQRPRCKGQGGEMHLERARVTGTGGVPLPTSKAIARLNHKHGALRAHGGGHGSQAKCASQEA